MFGRAGRPWPATYAVRVEAVVVLGGLALIVAGLVWVASRARGRRAGGAVLGAVDEIWHPAAYRPRVEIEVQSERAVPLPPGGDRPPPAAGGRALPGGDGTRPPRS